MMPAADGARVGDRLEERHPMPGPREKERRRAAREASAHDGHAQGHGVGASCVAGGANMPRP